MKFLIDAQLPPVLKFVFHQNNYPAIHTLDLPKLNDTSDSEINTLAMSDDYVVVTKDKDFYNSFLLNRQPKKLVLVKTGNTSIKELKTIFEINFQLLISALEINDLVIVGKNYISTEIE
jgi:predicted nuclease of predicted toxin-antitoxin system